MKPVDSHNSELGPLDFVSILVELLTISHSQDVPNGTQIGQAIDNYPPEVHRGALLQSIAMLHAANNIISGHLGIPVEQFLQRMGLWAARESTSEVE